MIRDSASTDRSKADMGSEREKAREIVEKWIGAFDPPPQINFQQSEILQGLIVRAMTDYLTDYLDCNNS